jgi:DNA-binding NarL/FixJ family response regulator
MNSKSGSLKVLVADDASLIRDRLVTMLREIPGVAIAGQTDDVPGTLAALRKLKPHVITLDLSMPGGNGLDVLRQINAEKHDVTVIVLTNYATPEYEQAARAAGAHRFFSKSHQFSEAIETIRHLADSSQSPSEPTLLS